MKMNETTEPQRITGSVIHSGGLSKKKPIMSISAARFPNKNILYLGVHGGTIQIEMSDLDADVLLDLLEELSHVST